MACQAIANIVKTSLGPVGLDKVRLYSFDTFDVWLIERDVCNGEKQVFARCDEWHGTV